MGSSPRQLVGPELTGVEVRWGVGDLVVQRVGQGQPGQNLSGPVSDRSGDHLQETRRPGLQLVLVQVYS